MKKSLFALKGNIIYSENLNKLNTIENGYLVCENGVVAGVFKTLPEKYSNIEVKDYKDSLIIPGLVDLHLHAPQYSYRGTGMDLELIDWLQTITFPQEAKYSDLEYAKKAYEIFANDLRKSPTTRAVIFGTMHKDATILLMELLEKSGVDTFVGKVNMDRNGPSNLQEDSPEKSAEDTRKWLEEIKGKFNNTKPILTPRFIPSCSDKLMSLLEDIQKEYNLPLQSHLSENLGELAWVKELCPWSKFYGDAYNHFNLFGTDLCPTIMAHCVYSTDEEIALMKKQGVTVAHCSQSNTNLSSGIAPIRRYLDEGLKVGLGSDIAGGSSLSLLKAMADSIQTSKLRWRLVDDSLKPLTATEVFYLGTEGGGKFFGKVGSFKEGYEFDAVVIDDSNIKRPEKLSIKDRIESVMYLSDDRNIIHKYVKGQQLF